MSSISSPKNNGQIDGNYTSPNRGQPPSADSATVAKTAGIYKEIEGIPYTSEDEPGASSSLTKRTITFLSLRNSKLNRGDLENWTLSFASITAISVAAFILKGTILSIIGIASCAPIGWAFLGIAGLSFLLAITCLVRHHCDCLVNGEKTNFAERLAVLIFGTAVAVGAYTGVGYLSHIALLVMIGITGLSPLLMLGYLFGEKIGEGR